MLVAERLGFAGNLAKVVTESSGTGWHELCPGEGCAASLPYVDPRTHHVVCTKRLQEDRKSGFGVAFQSFILISPYCFPFWLPLFLSVRLPWSQKTDQHKRRYVSISHKTAQIEVTFSKWKREFWKIFFLFFPKIFWMRQNPLIRFSGNTLKHRFQTWGSVLLFSHGEVRVS